jgi:flagellar protein FlbD
MIRLTRLNRAPMVLNSDLIEHIDVTPDTVITLTTGQILRVRESAEEVIRRIIGFRRQIFGPEGLPPTPLEEDIAIESDEARE